VHLWPLLLLLLLLLLQVLLLLTLAGAQGLEAGLVAQGVLAGLHHQSQTAVDVLLASLLR
jgi:small-conductance mechanosensitive channel